MAVLGANRNMATVVYKVSVARLYGRIVIFYERAIHKLGRDVDDGLRSHRSDMSYKQLYCSKAREIVRNEMEMNGTKPRTCL